MGWAGNWLNNLLNDRITGGGTIQAMGAISDWSYLHVQTTGSNYGITWWQSDERLKKNIKDSTYPALANVNKFRFIDYDWKNRPGSKHQTIGFLAQNLQKIDPLFVFEVKQKDGTELLQPNETILIPVIAKALAELSQKFEQALEKILASTKNVEALGDRMNSSDRTVASIRAENAALKKENEEIKARLDRLEKALLKK